MVSIKELCGDGTVLNLYYCRSHTRDKRLEPLHTHTHTYTHTSVWMTCQISTRSANYTNANFTVLIFTVTDKMLTLGEGGYEVHRTFLYIFFITAYESVII